ncbi:MAG: DUF3179 domain-containing protein [Armatimonadetes bacterium]|nr:DUF3179 domain-containing protein [Armatimonadota bacterium]
MGLWSRRDALTGMLGGAVSLAAAGELRAAEERKIIPRPGLYRALTEPPCSYCSTQNRKGLVRGEDRVIAWIRAAHNGGAIPIRHFLAAPRVINDTYGLFFYDPDGDYVSAFKKDYGYEFFGWRGGVMVVRYKDGSLFSALTGLGLQGPRKGERLQRIASFPTDWNYWLMLHPESTAYDLYDGKRYPMAELPRTMSREARESMGRVDSRLDPMALVHGVTVGNQTLAVALPEKTERACSLAQVGGRSVAVFWYGPTRSSVTFEGVLEGKALTFYSDSISPETAPFKDRETGTRWTLAGRGVDGPLRGKELTWVDGVQCRWYAWSNENPDTSLQAGGKPV